MDADTGAARKASLSGASGSVADEEPGTNAGAAAHGSGAGSEDGGVGNEGNEGKFHFEV